jgi:pimeloyl-ACP methyl ester carboxylesterase
LLQAARRRRTPLVMPTTVHIRRSYTECRFGQLHIATAYPSGGGFDERTPLLCLHPAGSSMNYFSPLLPELGRDRSVYAFDLPGYGSSDAPNQDLGIVDLAAAIDDFMQSLRVRSADIMGVQLGALVAIELALVKPQQCHKLVLSSVPHFNSQETKSMEWAGSPGVAMADGSHLLKEWTRLVNAHDASVSPDALTDKLTDGLRSRRRSAAAIHAMMDYPTQKKLAGLRQPGLILKPHDEFQDHAARAKSSYAQSVLEELPDKGANIFGAGAQRTLQLIRQFLDK